MAQPLPWMRYMLIIIPAISTAFVVDIKTYGYYIVYVLLLIWFVQIRNTWLHARLDGVAVIVELITISWLCSQFTGVWYVAFFSTLVSLFERHRSHRLKWSGVAALILCLNVALLPYSPEHFIVVNCLFLLVAGLLHVVNQGVNRTKRVEMLNDELRQKHYELDAAKARIVDYAKEVQRISQVEERNRISHDIHDDLGHKLIRIKMMLEAIIQIAPEQPSKALEMTMNVRDQLAASNESLRQTVRNLMPRKHEHEQYSLETLINEFAAQSNVAVHFQMSGMPFELYPSEEFVIYRNAQEAMTNAVRHGRATNIHMTLQYEHKAVRLIISNNGTMPEGELAKGLGFKGMEERSELLGGHVSVDYAEQFTVTTYLPHHGDHRGK